MPEHLLLKIQGSSLVLVVANDMLLLSLLLHAVCYRVLQQSGAGVITGIMEFFFSFFCIKKVSEKKSYGLKCISVILL